MGKIIEVRYNGEIGFKTTIKNVVDFLKIRMSVDEFLDFQNSEGISNACAIYNAYNQMESYRLSLKNANGSVAKTFDEITGDMPCPEPIVFAADATKVPVDIIVNQSNLLVNDEYVYDFKQDGVTQDRKAFSLQLHKFYYDYVQYINEGNAKVLLSEGAGAKTLPRMKVWIWCKALNNGGVFNNYSIFDLSPFISGCTVNQTETGGNFNVNLEPVNGLIETNDAGEAVGVWRPDAKQFLKFDQNGLMNFVIKNTIDKFGSVDNTKESGTYGTRYQNIEQNNINFPDLIIDEGDENGVPVIGGRLRTEDFFKNIISENDVIFISFNDNDEPVERLDDFFINCTEIPDKDWDMIGLVDSNGISTNYEGSSTTISVNGRDLMKLLIEDGTYFFAKSYANPDNENGIFNNINLQNAGDGVNTTNNRVSEVNPKGINRLITTGIIDMLYNPTARNVQFVMNLLMSRLANIEICHSDLFKSYGDRITEFQVPFFEVAEDGAKITEEDYAD